MRRARRWLAHQIAIADESDLNSAPVVNPTASDRRPGVLGYDDTVTPEEVNPERQSQDYDDFTTEEWAVADAALQDHLERRRARLEEAIPTTDAGVVRYGVSNWPYYPDDFAADWREALPLEDPRRAIGPPLRIQGTAQASASLRVAHDAIERARRDSNRPSDTY